MAGARMKGARMAGARAWRWEGAGKRTAGPSLLGEGPAVRALAAPGQLKGRRGWGRGLASAAGGPDRLAQRAHRGQHGGRLVAAVCHAVGAARVLAASVRVPVGGL